MNYFKCIAISGLRKSDSYQDRRSVILTNYVSIILFSVVIILFVMRAFVYQNLKDPEYLALCGVVFALPLALNIMNRTRESRLLVCFAPPIAIWCVFVKTMYEMDPIPSSAYDGLRLYLLASSCIPYLVLNRSKPVWFALGIIPSIVSVFFYSNILDALGVGFTAPAGSDAELMQIRFVLSYVVISGGCYMLQSVILRSDELNRQLIASLQEKTAQIECQNGELLRNQNQLARINQDLEQMVDERSKKITHQKDRMLSYAYANAHYVRGPIARLMGLVELYKIDRDLDCDWLLKTVDRETRDIDLTIRRISTELQQD